MQNPRQVEDLRIKLDVKTPKPSTNLLAPSISRKETPV